MKDIKEMSEEELIEMFRFFELEEKEPEKFKEFCKENGIEITHF